MSRLPIVTLFIYNIHRVHHAKCQAELNHNLKSRLLGEISTTSDMHMITTLMAESKEELNSLLMK